MSENTNQKVVNCHNEWDLLEEVIVGNIDGACVPGYDQNVEATMPSYGIDYFKKNGGKPFPPEQIAAAKKNLDEFVHILKAEGVKVVRPDVLDHCKPYSTPDWESPGGLYAAMPRDVMLVVGDDMIEGPMAWRSRYWEINAYRTLLKDYFKRGARWTQAPKPMLTDELFNKDYRETSYDEEMIYAITEFEPTFDAADFMRCGKDLFVQKSHVTNEFGIEWLQRHLGDEYKIHTIEVHDRHPMHIDASLVPLAPGKLLLNPERIKKVPDQFKNWDILWAPKPVMPDSQTLYMTSKWLNMNVISLDHERIMVEKNEIPFINALKDWGFKPIPCNFYDFNTFGGSFHCATMDIRRKGELESYF